MPNLGPWEIAIIAIVILVLFGGAKLAGLGKSTGRALREFKEETKGIRDEEEKKKAAAAAELSQEPSNEQLKDEVVDAEIAEYKPRSES